MSVIATPSIFDVSLGESLVIMRIRSIRYETTQPVCMVDQPWIPFELKAYKELDKTRLNTSALKFVALSIEHWATETTTAFGRYTAH